MRWAVVVVLCLAVANCEQTDKPPPSPGGDMATCMLEAPRAATAQARARVGAYYFDGWSGPLTNSHFMGMVDGPYKDREPYTGWGDNDPCTIEKQLATARAFGIDFFIYDWYYG